jgi:hypothetical protein
MANEFQVDYIPGATVYFLVRDYLGRIWSTVASSFGTYATVTLANYDVSATEQGTASGYYVADAPAGLPKGVYNVVAKVQAGGSPSEVDLTIGFGTLEFPPAWFEYGGQTIKNDGAGTIVRKDRDGNTVSSQTFTSASGVDTINAAS